MVALANNINRTAQLPAWAVALAAALHLFLVAWFMPSTSQVKFTSQQMVSVSLIAPTPEKQISRSFTKPAEKITETGKTKQNPLSDLSPSAARTTSQQATITKPVHDAQNLNNPSPQYPKTAKRLGMQGVVMLEVKVTESGTVRNISISESSGFELLDNSALETVYKWKFIPASLHGKPVESTIVIPIEFRLE